jgi:ubiquinone/menaquinone biosynthesis C-methylase UbiE
VDLSPHYVARARRLMPRELNVSLLADNAERLPFVDGHFDAVTCLFLFHELPGDVRARVAAEMARVVRPGGLVVLGDSLQLGDAPELREEIESFPRDYHEPYYLSWVRDDPGRRLRDAGLSVQSEKAHFLTKVVVAEKPA